MSALDIANEIHYDTKNNTRKKDAKLEMAYQYVWVKKLYHVSNYPKVFTYPLFIIVEKLRELTKDTQSYSFLENIDPRFKEIIDQLRIYGEISEGAEKYLQTYYECNYLTETIIIK